MGWVWVDIPVRKQEGMRAWYVRGSRALWYGRGAVRVGNQSVYWVSNCRGCSGFTALRLGVLVPL